MLMKSRKPIKKEGVLIVRSKVIFQLNSCFNFVNRLNSCQAVIKISTLPPPSLSANKGNSTTSFASLWPWIFPFQHTKAHHLSHYIRPQFRDSNRIRNSRSYRRSSILLTGNLSVFSSCTVGVIVSRRNISHVAASNYCRGCGDSCRSSIFHAVESVSIKVSLESEDRTIVDCGRSKITLLDKKLQENFSNRKKFENKSEVASLHSSVKKKLHTTMAGKKRVCIVGSGNWGSAIAKIVGENVVKFNDMFEDTVNMYVYEELVNGRKLTEIINQDHENVKYLPGHKLPANIIAVPDVVATAKDADILIFVLPHQFIKHTCKPLAGTLKPDAFGLSLIKGFDVAEGGGIELISSIITKVLNIPCNVLMGANLAGEIADGKFSETTIGVRDANHGKLLHKLIQTDNFRVVVVKDVETVELCGALKNIVAVGAGFIDGLQLGDNTKAAVIRLGLMEMVRFTQEFFNKDTQVSTFLESCGVADLITTCYGGRNRKVSEAYVKTGKSFEELEKEMLNGQRLQGPMTAAEVNVMLKSRGLEHKFPLFTAVHRISNNELKPAQLIDAIRNHPEHISSLANANA